mmetsp:Transcript_36878/g.79639  ORF Transcript_36878/g.79639 Transcript_36878/m.79639 type:complete len:1203 (-) Transcript_36878:573-4181(-)
MAGGGDDSFIQPLGFLLGLTAILALLLSYLNQSSIIAFILVGVIVSAVGVEPDTGTLGHISEVGILILLFMAGLEVDLGAFLKNWKTAAIVGIGQIVSSTGFFAGAAVFVLPAIGAEVNVNSCVYFGLCMCFSSTILVLGYLKNTKSMGTLYGQLCLGTLVLQDAASVLGIAVLGGLQDNQGGTEGSGGTCRQVTTVDCSAAKEDAEMCAELESGCTIIMDQEALFGRFLADEAAVVESGCTDACAALDPYSSNFAAECSALGSGVCIYEEGDSAGSNGGIAVSILVLFAKLLAAMLICFLLERFVLDRMFRAFARSLELLYLGALGYATGLAAIAVTAGFSGEITAFLAGVSLSRLPYKMHIETKMEPIKTLGVAIFFLSLGLQLELGKEMVDALPIGFGLAFFTLFATLPLFAALGVPAGLKSHTVFMLGLLMNQISEFSLILCTLCVRAKVFEPVVLTVMTVAAVVSIIVSSMGHAYIDAIYRRAQRWTCLRCLDSRRARKLLREHKKDKGLAASKGDETYDDDLATNAELEATIDDPAPSPLVRRRPSSLGSSQAWAFEDQLKLRTTEHLEIDLKETEKELEELRESMAATADEKRLQLSSLDKSTRKLQLYGLDNVNKGGVSSSRMGGSSIIRHSHASDIMHGMIEGYVVVDHELMFCTLRAGRMLFWKDQHDVGHAPPASVWDVSGMAILKRGGENGDNDDDWRSVDSVGFYHDENDEMQNPWEWTIVLGHIKRQKGTSSIEDDAMKLAIHGLEDHSDHDAQDWDDALAVATSTLNPIALRLAHIREELHHRSSIKNEEGTDPMLQLPMTGFESRIASNSHRNEIICIGYNEMFPAVLALADAIGKEVVVVEYDPMKLNTIKKLYSEENRRRYFREKSNKKKGGVGKKSSSTMATLSASKSTESLSKMATVSESKSTDDRDGGEGVDIELGSSTESALPGRVSSAGNLMTLGGMHEPPSPHRVKFSGSTQSVLPRRVSSGGNLFALGAMHEPPSSGSTESSLPKRVSSGGNLQRLGAKSQSTRTPRRVRMMSSTTGSIGQKGFWGMSHSNSNEPNNNDSISGEEKIKGVKCEYADIHDPECWEELEMDKAFMIISTMKGARHAEKAMLEWLRRHKSETIFVACSQNNADAMRMYKAGAHFVMQTDALAMRSTRDIFLETVANVGDCSQLVAVGLAHKERLIKLQADNSLKFQYETG